MNRNQNSRKLPKPSIPIEKRTSIINQLNRLWIENATWSKILIVSSASASPDLQHVVKRLIKSPEDISKVIEPFCGQEKTLKIKQLLLDSTMLCIKLINDMKTGNMRSIIDTGNKLTNSYTSLSSYMSQVNPGWKREELQKLFSDYFKKIESCTAERLRGNYILEITAFEELQDIALDISRVMCNGIFNQSRN